MITVKINRQMEQEEWLELANFVEHQRTAETSKSIHKYRSTQMAIKGDYANIIVDVDADGNITIL